MDEIRTQSEAWLKKLGITAPCGLDKLNSIELRDLARQIDWAVNQARRTPDGSVSFPVPKKS